MDHWILKNDWLIFIFADRSTNENSIFKIFEFLKILNKKKKIKFGGIKTSWTFNNNEKIIILLITILLIIFNINK